MRVQPLDHESLHAVHSGGIKQYSSDEDKIPPYDTVRSGNLESGNLNIDMDGLGTQFESGIGLPDAPLTFLQYQNLIFLHGDATQVDMLSAPTEPPQPGDSCCAPPPASSVIVHAPSPLEKIFDGVRDVNVSVALMEDFMRCVP